MTENEIHRDIGALTAQVKILNDTLQKVENKLERLENAFEQGKGGWRVFAATAGVLGGVAGFLATSLKLKILGG